MGTDYETKRVAWRALADDLSRFADGEVALTAGREMFCGRIKSVAITRSYIEITLNWMASSPLRTKPIWTLEKNFNKLTYLWNVSSTSAPSKDGATIRFEAGSHQITLYPKSAKNKLDPKQVKGL